MFLKGLNGREDRRCFTTQWTGNTSHVFEIRNPYLSISQRSSQVTLEIWPAIYFDINRLKTNDVLWRGIAEAVHLIPTQYCTDPKKKRYKPYSTRLALSHDMNGFCDKAYHPSILFSSASEPGSLTIDSRWIHLRVIQSQCRRWLKWFSERGLKNYLQYHLKPGTRHLMNYCTCEKMYSRSV